MGAVHLHFWTNLRITARVIACMGGGNALCASTQNKSLEVRTPVNHHRPRRASLATPCANHHLPSGSVERTTASNDCQHTARHSQVCFQRPHTSLWHRARRCGIVRVVVASCIIARSYTSHFHAAATDRRQQVEGERPRCSGGARDFCRCQLVRTSTSRSKP